MAKKASVEAVLSLNTSDWKKGLAQAKSDASAWQQSVAAQAAPPLNRVGNPNADWQRAMMHAQTGLPLPGFLQARNAAPTMTAAAPGSSQNPGIDRQSLSSFGQYNHLLGTATLQSAALSREQKRLRESSQMAGMGILEISRAFEDAQYGFRGVMNNLPGIVQSFGGTAGLAGAVSLAAVSVYSLTRAWTYMQQAMGNEDGPEAAAAKQRKLAAAMRESARRASESVAAFDKAYGENLTARRQGALEYLDIEASRTQQLAEAQRDLAAAKNASLTGADRVRSESGNRLAMEEKQLRTQLDLINQKTPLIEAQVKEDTARLNKLKEQLAAMKQISEVSYDMAGRRSSRLRYQDEAGAEVLQRKIDIASNTLNRSQESRTAILRQKEEAEFHRTQILPLKKKQAEEEIKNATDAEARQRASKRKKEIAAAFDLLGDVAETMADALKDAQEAAQKLQDQARALKETREDATVDHLRSRGRGAAADRRQRALTEERRARQLQEDNPGMSADEAKRQARQERIDSRRGISGAQNARPFQGIDAFRAGRMARPEFPALDGSRRAPSPSRRVPAAEKGGAAADPAAAAVDRSTERIVSKLDELKPLMQQPVADRLKPAA